MRRLTAGGIALVIAAGTAAGGIAAAAPGAASKPATISTRHTSLGTVLVNARGRTLYLFEKDEHGRSACSGACATSWPPVLTQGRPKASHSARKGQLGTTRRSDGTTQVTYRNQPLYTFVADRKAGDTKGEGVDAFGAEWYVLAPSGKKIEKHGDDG